LWQLDPAVLLNGQLRGLRASAAIHMAWPLQVTCSAGSREKYKRCCSENAHASPDYTVIVFIVDKPAACPTLACPQNASGQNFSGILMLTSRRRSTGRPR
jgi:hypothetical protein